MNESSYPFPPPEMLFMDKTVERMLEVGGRLLDFVDQRGFLTLDGGVLDVGCGYGRLAYALLDRGFTGSYLGFDILKKHITWLQENLEGQVPASLEFRHLDIRNGRYNPSGLLDACEIKLPVPSLAPDLVLAFSVFTHMYAEETVHYLAELSALMDDRSVLCATFFLLNDSQAGCEAEGRSDYPMRHFHARNSRYFNEEDPLHAIAHRESWVEEACGEAGLALAEPAHLGSWCGRSGAECFQDTLFLQRR